MKCPKCWTEKVGTRQVKGWKRVLLTCLLLRPMKCYHCYHKFVSFWLLTIGRSLYYPTLRIAPDSRTSSNSTDEVACAAQHLAAARTKHRPDNCTDGGGPSSRADAA